jgi:DUF4097 and DUF4098 domain-containing protein YvlB
MTKICATAFSAGLVLAALSVATAASAEALEGRLVRQSFPVTAGQTLRLANLAGRVDLVPGSGPQIVVEATVHAEGDSAAETQKLLAGMRWVRSHDSKGREEMALSYPVETYHGFHFPRRNQEDSDLPRFLSFLADSGHTSTLYRGERVRIYPRRRSGVPTLYADLRIAIPPGVALAVHDALGAVRGEDLTGNVEVDTGSGDVRFGAFSGNLKITTGSGDVRLGAARGETAVQTGSGNISVGNLVGNGSFGTGSGDVVIDQAAAGKLSLDTGSGNVVLKAGTVAKIVAKTGSGDVRMSKLELEELVADTGSGNVTLESSLAQARQVRIGTGSGDIRIHAGEEATFDVVSDQGSGDLRVGYADATLRKHGSKVIGAHRGDGRTQIHIETGSGDCSITPKS